MSPRLTPKGENARQQILEAAYRVFLEKGYHAASMRDIAGRCGMTTGGLYAHYAGKEEIFTAVLAANNPFMRVLPALQEADGETVEAILHDAARRMVTALGADREALNLMFIEIVEFQCAHLSDLFPVVFPQILHLLGRVAGLQGDLRPEIPLPVLGRSFFGLIFSYFMTNIVLSDRLPFDPETLDQFVDIYLYGILASGPAEGVPDGSHPNEAQP
ncbi:MAG TPA: TetR/AcrR family transcriptional regulator [Anaerolineaceae bacterium]|nr:TetR/AcrR family transcriptional regulator [Anaerolineaceae bacterium]